MDGPPKNVVGLSCAIDDTIWLIEWPNQLAARIAWELQIGMAILRVDTDDIDEAIAIGDRVFYQYSVKRLSVGAPFSYSLRAGSLGPIEVGVVRFGCGVALDVASAEGYSVLATISGRLDLRIGSQQIVANSRQAAVFGPDAEVGVEGWHAGTDWGILLKFDQDAVESELTKMIGRDVDRPLHLDPRLDLTEGFGAQWWQQVRAVMSSLEDSDGLAWNPLVSAPLARALTAGLLLATGHRYRDQLDQVGRTPLPPTIQRAVAIMQERAHLPLTAAEVAAEVGFGLRSLQAGFRQHLGVSPSQYLQRIRLNHARHDLATGTPQNTSVTDVAARWGFTHLSRFAGAYRRQFGELPSHTLRDR